MASSRRPRQRPPLDSERLEELAIRYVGRYATTGAKLRSYLARKLRERGWSEAREPDLDRLAERFRELGYVDDAAYAMAKSQALSSRGYGKRRLDEKLRIAGVADGDGSAAREHADAQALESALRFAERRRIGPFAQSAPDPRQKEKAIAAMIRAGHSFGLSRAIASLAPGAEVDRDDLQEQSR